MLPPGVERRIAEIASDHRSGASQLARLGVEALAALVHESGSSLHREETIEAVRRLKAAQPANAALYNVAHLFEGLVAEGHGPQDVLLQLRNELDSAHEKVARNFIKAAPRAGRAVTLTYSDNVIACLRLAKEKGLLEGVYVMESRPLLEGRSLAVALAKAGLDSILVPDAAGPALMAEASYAILGADSILRDASIVNKVGSYALALASADHRKDVFIACESLKFDARYDAATWPASGRMPSEEVWDARPESIDVMNRYFEVVPARLVTRVATDRGSYTPDTVRMLLAKASPQSGP